MKILFIDSNHEVLHSRLQAAGHVCDLNYHWTKEEIENNIHSYDGIVIRSRVKLDKNIISKGTQLKFIARAGAGMENIDVDFAESKGIKCLHAPEGNRDAVAEHTLAMLLGLFNNICRADKEVRTGKWIREGNRGIELFGKTVGIIGYGNMGSALTERLKGFGVKVLVFDKYKKGFGTEHIIESDLQTIFNETDILSLHTPLTEETTYMLNEKFFNSFKKSIYVINTARGKCLKTEDLVTAIQTGKVKGACLDVLEYEMSSFEKLEISSLPEAFQYLAQSDKVVLSPHIGGWTFESNERIANVLADKILRLNQTPF